MVKHILRCLARGALAGATACALVAAPALAAGAQSIGQNVGNLLESWAKPIFLGILALYGIPHLIRRDVAGGAVFAALACLIGIFVLYGAGVERLILAIAKFIVP
jgi:hypothetical protein